jgi:hypothetical protein
LAPRGVPESLSGEDAEETEGSMAATR